MPKTIGGIFGFAIASLIATAVGLAVLSRIPTAWNLLVKRSA